MSFRYHAYALALGGAIRRPFHAVIPSQGSVALAVTGGFGSARLGPTSIEPGISFGSAYCEVSGSRSAKGFETVATTVIEDLSIAGGISARRLTARLSSSHSGARGDVSHLQTTGTSFEGLTIGGFRVDVELFDFRDVPTMASFVKKYKSDAQFRKEADRVSLWAPVQGLPDDVCKDYDWCWKRDATTPPESNGRIMTSVVKNVHVAGDALQVIGNIVFVPHFGRIHLGELLLTEGSRRLTSLRLELDGPTEGTLTVGDPDTNGTTYP